MQIINHIGSHVVGQYFLEDNIRRFQIKEDEMHAKKLTSDAMYILKCATADVVLAKKSDPENMNDEELRKVLAPLRRQKCKEIPKKGNYLLFCYC